MTEKHNITKSIQNIEMFSESLKKKDFTLFFFIVDSKNIPNGSMQYIYQFAKTCIDNGYNAKLIYQIDNEYTDEEIEKMTKRHEIIDENRRFVGVKEWLGDEYDSIPRINIQNGDWRVGPADFLFIPEVFSSMMRETFDKKIPCARYVILQNFNYITDYIPIGDTWASYGIENVVCTSKNLLNMINNVFSFTKGHTTIIEPYIPYSFCYPKEAKSLIVNIVAKNQDNVNKIVKNFYWKYPHHQFITFHDLRSLSKEDFEKSLKNGAITVWVDEDTPFGYSAIESIKCGDILIGKVPEIMPDWMLDENNELTNAGVWFSQLYEAPDLIESIVDAWMNDIVPDEITKSMEKISAKFTYESFSKNIQDFLDKAIVERLKIFNETKEELLKQIDK